MLFRKKTNREKVRNAILKIVENKPKEKDCLKYKKIILENSGEENKEEVLIEMEKDLDTFLSYEEESERFHTDIWLDKFFENE